VIVDENESSLVSKRKLLDAARRWSNILMLTRWIVENIAPDMEPEEIADAPERGLKQ
jgi:hypothetical protein